jgi:flagellar hook-length control protein FliK
VKIGVCYQLSGPPIAGPPKKSIPKPAEEKGEYSPFQQLLATIETNAKNEEGNVLISNERFSAPPKEHEDVTGQVGMEEWFSFLLFMLNNMADADQRDLHNHSIEQINNVAAKEAFAQFIKQINNIADKDMLIEQISNVINGDAASHLHPSFDDDTFAQFIKQINNAADKDMSVEQISNVINAEAAFRLHPFADNDIQHLVQMKESKEQIDIQALLWEMLARFDKQEAKSEGVSSSSKTTERPMFQNRFSLPSDFSKSFDSSLGDKAAAEDAGREKEFLIQPFNRLLPNGNMMISRENAPVIVLDQMLSEQKVNEAFLQQLTTILQSGRFARLKNGNAQLVIRLYPEHLGTLTVKIAREHGTLAAKLIASTDSAKELLDANLSQLQQVLSTEHITVEKWDVLTQDDRYTPAFYQEERGHEQKERQQRKEEKSKKQPPFNTLMAEMIDTEA